MENFANLVYTLESDAKPGDQGSLSSVYLSMFRKNLLSSNELEIMMNGWRKPPVRAAAAMAIGNIFVDQLSSGDNTDRLSRRSNEVASGVVTRSGSVPRSYEKRTLRRGTVASPELPDVDLLGTASDPINKTRVNYLKLCLREELSVATAAAQSLFTISEASAKVGRDIDWELMHRMKEYFIDRKTSVPGMASFIHKGIASLCQTCKEVGKPIPDSLESLGDPPLDREGITPRLAPFFSSDVESDREDFRSSANNLSLIIKRDLLTREEWRAAVWRKEIAPNCNAYGPDRQEAEKKVKKWYEHADARVAAANAGVAFLFHDNEQPMTPEFREFFHSEEGFKNSSFCKHFRAYEYRYATANKAVFAFSREVLSSGKNDANVLIGMFNQYTAMNESEPLTLRAMSKMPSNNALMSTSPLIIDVDKDNSVTTPAAFTMNDDKLHYAFDPDAKIPLDYIHDINSLESGKPRPWAAYLEETDIPRTVSHAYIICKDLTGNILRKKGIPVPDEITFYSEKENWLPPKAFIDRQAVENAYNIDKLDKNYVIKILKEFTSAADGKAQKKGLVVKEAEGVGGQQVTFFDDKDDGLLDRTADKIISVGAEGRTMVVQETVRSPKLHSFSRHSKEVASGKAPLGTPIEPGEEQELDCCNRTFVVPNERDSPVACGTYARIGKVNLPVNIATGAEVMLGEKWLERLLLEYPEQEAKISIAPARMDQVSIDSYVAIREKIERDGQLRKFENPFPLMGIDIMLDNDFNPIIVEGNGPGSGGFNRIDEGVSDLTEDSPLRKKYEDGILGPRLIGANFLRYAQQYHERQLNSTSRALVASPDPIPMRGRSEVVSGGPLRSTSVPAIHASSRDSSRSSGELRSPLLSSSVQPLPLLSSSVQPPSLPPPTLPSSVPPPPPPPRSRISSCCSTLQAAWQRGKQVVTRRGPVGRG